MFPIFEAIPEIMVEEGKGGESGTLFWQLTKNSLNLLYQSPD